MRQRYIFVIDMEYYVRSGSLDGYTQLVVNKGGNPFIFLEKIGISNESLLNPDTMISYRRVAELLEITAKQLNSPTFGFDLGLEQGLSTLGLLGAHVAKQDSLASVFEVARKYTFMHAQGIELDLRFRASGVEIAAHILFDELGQYQQVVQLTLALLHKIILETSQYQSSAKELNLRFHNRNLLIEQVQSLFNCSVKFCSDNNSIIYPVSLLNVKPVYSPELISLIIRKQFRSYDTLPNAGDLLVVQHAIKMLLPTGECSKESIADSLGMHPKKLERNLKDAGTTFRDLLEVTRKEVAVDTIKMSNMSLTMLALNLGYGDFSAFSRSFKKWFGEPPSAYRERVTLSNHSMYR